MVGSGGADDDDVAARWACALYTGVVMSITPFLHLSLQFRRLQGYSQYCIWRERLGYSSRNRPSGMLIWFHAVSVGEGISAIPVISRCRDARPSITILMTTSTAAAHSVLEQRLPPEVILQFAPIDTPAAVKRFLLHWAPQAAIFMESELWPTLILQSAVKGIPLALLNARMSLKSFERWSASPMRPLVAAMLSRFSLIAPLSNKEAFRYQILGAAPSVIHFLGNLKYACAVGDSKKEQTVGMTDIEAQLIDRKVWLAASTHAEEEDAIIRIHKELNSSVSQLLTIIAPRHPNRGQHIMIKLQQQGFNVAVRSHGQRILGSTDVYLVDTLGELNHFYATVPIAFVGGSLSQGLAGHNVAEAAAAGCVVLTGHHVGHFQEMVREMQKMSPFSVVQVDEDGLLNALLKFLTDEASLAERRVAAERAISAGASGVVTGVWESLESHILTKALR